MQSQLRFQSIDRFPPAFNLSNVTDPVCSAPPPTCPVSTPSVAVRPAFM